jgi:hypothetical protein
MTLQLPCLECAREGCSCCTGMQVYMTTGDVERISMYTCSDDFIVMEARSGEYQDSAGDATWWELIMQPDGRRRVLKVTHERDCIFLSRSGCVLPLRVRPLLCRLHPYGFDESGIVGVSSACRIGVSRDQKIMFALLGMTPENVREWHTTLYAEIKQERHHRVTPRFGNQCYAEVGRQFSRGL